MEQALPSLSDGTCVLSALPTSPWSNRPRNRLHPPASALSGRLQRGWCFFQFFFFVSSLFLSQKNFSTEFATLYLVLADRTTFVEPCSIQTKKNIGTVIEVSCLGDILSSLDLYEVDFLLDSCLGSSFDSLTHVSMVWRFVRSGWIHYSVLTWSRLWRFFLLVSVVEQFVVFLGFFTLGFICLAMFDFVLLSFLSWWDAVEVFL